MLRSLCFYHRNIHLYRKYCHILQSISDMTMRTIPLLVPQSHYWNAHFSTSADIHIFPLRQQISTKFPSFHSHKSRENQ